MAIPGAPAAWISGVPKQAALLPAIHQAFQTRPAGCDYEQLGCRRAPESSGCMFQNHHILLQHFRDHPVISFLADRFNPDAIRNRMFLPSSQGVATDLTSSPHTGGHLGAYFQGFRDYLEDVQQSRTYAAALAGNTRELDEVASDVNALVAAAKYALANGHLFANTPARMTPEEANAVNKKWFEEWRKYAADNHAQIQEMQETVDQFSNAGKPDAGLYFPLLSPTSDLGMAERIEVLDRFSKGGSPISLQFTAVGPIPSLPGLVPSFVATRLPGFIPPVLEGVNEPEGFTPSNPLLTHGLPGFPVPSADWQRALQLPPTTASPPEPQVLQFNPETSDLLRRSDGSLLMGPDPYNLPYDPADRPAVLRGLAIFGGAMVAPELLPLLPAWLPITGALGLTGAASSAAGAEPASGKESGVSAVSASHSGAQQSSDHSLDQNSARASNFTDRFGQWTEAADGAMPVQSSSGIEGPVTPGAATLAPEEVRRLTRVNESNAGSVFASGSAPVPYLPSAQFHDRFGNWTMPTAYGQQPEPSRPIGSFANEPSYFIPPPIFGVDGAGSPHNDAEEWYARWIRPLRGPE